MHSIYYLNYASVLLEIARQQNKMSKYEKDVQTLLDTFHRNKNFQEFIVNTSIPSVYRKKAFLDIFQKKFDKKFIYFIWTIIDFRRSRNINKILKVFLKLIRQELGVLFVKVTSAFPLHPTQRKKIDLAIKKRLNHKKIFIYNSINPSILGGLKIESGAISIDGSLKNKLNLMKKETYRSIHSGEILEEDYVI